MASKPKYSIVVPLNDRASQIAECLAGLAAQTIDRDRFEIIVAGNHGTDETAAIVQKSGARLVHRDAQNAYAARNLGIKAAQGTFIVFLEPDCVPQPDWLVCLDVESDNPTVGCFAGEILFHEPATSIGRFAMALEPLRQRRPLSGWQVRPYALLANAMYRKEVFDQAGLFDPTLACGGDAILAWRMLDRTAFQIKFVPEAIVFRDHPRDVAELWTEGWRQGGSSLTWALAEAGQQLPSLAEIENEIVTGFTTLASKLEESGAAEEQTLFPLLHLTSQIAQFAGGLEELQRRVAPGKSVATLADVARDYGIFCDICGSRSFVPGPRQRMVGRRAPQCLQCGSLERHRILHRVFATMDRKELSRWTCLSVVEPLPKYLKRFSRTNHVDLARLGTMGAPAWDVVVAMNILSRPGYLSFEDTLAALVGPLKDDGMLILLDMGSRLAGGTAVEYERRIASHLPNVWVRSNWVPDPVTKTTQLLTLASPDASRPSRLALQIGAVALAT